MSATVPHCGDCGTRKAFTVARITGRTTTGARRRTTIKVAVCRRCAAHYLGLATPLRGIGDLSELDARTYVDGAFR